MPPESLHPLHSPHLLAGANLANGWLMRPGSSVIELTPYQFETGRGSFVFSITNANVSAGWLGWEVCIACWARRGLALNQVAIICCLLCMP